MRDLNFVLQSEIFVNSNEQLHASHLILGCNSVYSTWQPFGQALLVDSPLLSYIDVRHPNFFPPNLIVGEAWDLGPRIVRAESLVLVRDESANLVYQNRTIHRPVGKPQTLVQPTEQEAAKSVNSSEAVTDQGKEEMVSKRRLTLKHFLPSARPAT